jgi:hypothetical protein
MLAVHWSPVKNTKKILKNGITKSKNGLYCFPLTGKKNIDQWWVMSFNLWRRRHRKQYNGFVFKIKKDDLPAVFDHGYGYTSRDTFKMEINELKELELRYRERIINNIGKNIVKNNFNKSNEYIEIAKIKLKKYPHFYKSLDDPFLLTDAFSDWLESKSIDEYEPLIDVFIKTGRNELQQNPKLLKETLNDSEFLENAFSDWQIILSKSISPYRIIKIISNRDEYGKVLHKKKKNEYIDNSNE